MAAALTSTCYPEAHSPVAEPDGADAQPALKAFRTATVTLSCGVPLRQVPH